MNTLLKHIFVFSLLFVVAGAVSFCVFNGPSPTAHGEYSMPLHQDGFLGHILRIQELTSATITTTFLALALFFLTAVGVAGAFYKSILFSPLLPPGFLRQKRRGIFSVVRRTMHHWLSLFEGSPNVLKPA